MQTSQLGGLSAEVGPVLQGVRGWGREQMCRYISMAAVLEML